MEKGKVIYIVHPDPGRCAQLASLLSALGHVEAIGDSLALLERASARPADLLVIGAADGGPLLEVARLLSAAFPHVAILALCPGFDLSLVRKLLASGADDVLEDPCEDEELLAVARSLIARPPGDEEVLRGVTVAVASAKGGAGCSTLSVALVRELGRNGPALLVDLAPPYGGLEVLTDLSPQVTLGSIAARQLPATPKLLRELAAAHRAGFSLLTGLRNRGDTEFLDGRGFRDLLDSASLAFPFTVFDLGMPVTNLSFDFLLKSSVSLLVTTLEVASLRNLRLLLEDLESAGRPPAQVLVVANRVDPRGPVTVKQAQEHLKVPVAASLPTWDDLPHLADRGRLVDSLDSCPWGDAVPALAGRVVEIRRSKIKQAVGGYRDAYEASG